MTRLRQFVPPALLAAGYAGLVAAVVGHWRADLSAVDRHLVLAGAAGAVLLRRREATPTTPRPFFGSLVATVGAVLYPVGWAGYFVLYNARSVPFWLLWVALTLATAGWLLAAFGRRAVVALLFPLVFVAFALPPPESVLHGVQQRLQAITTDTSAAVLGVCGYAVTRPAGGFLLGLPGGELGVEESCSGVTALTALTAVAAFLAFGKRFGVVRGVLLVAAAVPVVVGVNVLRVTLSGVIQEAAGAAYIRGGWHDALGFGTALVGTGVVWLLAKCVAPRGAATARPVAPAPPPGSPSLVVVALACSLVASVVVVWHGRTLVPPPVPTPPLDELSPRLGEWAEAARPPVPPHVAELLQADVIAHREYRNPLGRSATVWVIYWTSAHAVRGYHHPDVCLPNVGYRETDRGVVQVSPGGGELPLTSRTLAGQGGDLYVLYWTQTGRRVWGPDDEAEAHAGLDSARTLRRAATRWTEPPPEPAGRLVVLIGSRSADAFGKREVEAFARDVADDVYRLCPSARR